jgi:hypothetical protein
MKIYNPNNIIRYKNNYYCKVKVKTINLLFKYKTKSVIFVLENEPILLGDMVCVFETDNKKTTENCVIRDYLGEEEHLVNKIVPYGIPEYVYDLYDRNEIKDFDVILLKVNKVLGMYVIDEQDNNIIYESLLNEFNKKETKLERWFYNFKEKYFI